MKLALGCPAARAAQASSEPAPLWKTVDPSLHPGSPRWPSEMSTQWTGGGDGGGGDGGGL